MRPSHPGKDPLCLPAQQGLCSVGSVGALSQAQQGLAWAQYWPEVERTPGFSGGPVGGEEGLQSEARTTFPSPLLAHSAFFSRLSSPAVRQPEPGVDLFPVTRHLGLLGGSAVAQGVQTWTTARGKTPPGSDFRAAHRPGFAGPARRGRPSGAPRSWPRLLPAGLVEKRAAAHAGKLRLL